MIIEFKLKKIGALLVLVLALCGCEKFAKRAPAPWNGYDLNLLIGTPSSGGSETMNVFEGSTSRASDSGGGGFIANAFYRVDQIRQTGVILEVDIEGSTPDANKKKIPFHLKQTVLVPYQGDVSLPILDDLVFNARFVPNPARLK